MRLLLATGNAGKLAEMRKLLVPLGTEIVSPRELGIALEVKETGESFEENARLKAQNACRLSGLPSIGEDSGLCVDFLDGAPGLYSRRFGGEGLSDRELCLLILEKLEKTEQRSAKFVSTIVCSFPDGHEIISSGECTGIITDKLMGEAGFGYDPIFYVSAMNKTMAQMTQDEKNRISHRGVCMREFAEKLRVYMKGSTIC